MQKAREISEQINHLKRDLRAESINKKNSDGLIEYGDFDIMSKYFPKLRIEIMNTDKSISYDFATSIGQLLTDDLKVSEWNILKGFIEGKK